jgi:hypothetical protein
VLITHFAIIALELRSASFDPGYFLPNGNEANFDPALRDDPKYHCLGSVRDHPIVGVGIGNYNSLYQVIPASGIDPRRKPFCAQLYRNLHAAA